MQILNILKSTLIMVVVLGVTAGCAAQAGKHEAKDVQKSKMHKVAERAITVAEASRKKARGVGGEWRDTSKIIKKARKALKSGDTKKALKLANQARHQGQMGYEQSMGYSDLKNDHYGR